MRQRIDDLVDLHPVGLRRVLHIPWKLGRIGPLPAVAHVRVPVDQDHRPPSIILYSTEVGGVAPFFPGAALQERAESWRLRERREVVEAMKDRVLRRKIDDLAIGKHPLQLAFEIQPLDRTVKIVERQRAAAQEELAKDRNLRFLEPKIARLDDVDPGIVPEVGILGLGVELGQTGRGCVEVKDASSAVRPTA